MAGGRDLDGLLLALISLSDRGSQVSSLSRLLNVDPMELGATLA